MKGKIIGLVEFKRREKSNKRLGQRQHFKFFWTEEKSSNGAFYYSFSHMHASASHTQAQTKQPQASHLISLSDTPHLIPPSLEESGFMEVECFTILYIVTTRKMTLTCQNRRVSRLTDCT